MPWEREARAAVLACAAALAAACSAIEVRTDHDPSADFVRYHTFELTGGKAVAHVGGLRVDDPLVSERVKEAVTRQLQLRGLQPAQGEPPDLYVTFVAGARERIEYDTVGSPYYSTLGWWGWGPGWWAPGYQDWWSRTYTEGTLVIDLIDARTRRLVWRAYTQQQAENPGQNARMVDAAVTQAFKRFPPGAAAAYGGSGPPTR